MGRGRSASGGGRAGGGGGISVKQKESLISAREEKPSEVDQVLNVLRDIEKDYGLDIDVSDVQLVTMSGKRGQGVMAYYDSAGNLAVNQAYFDDKAMTQAYDNCVKNGFHPPRGDKTAMEATVAHEMGHRLNHVAAGGSWGGLDQTARDIVFKASRAMGYSRMEQLQAKISGYAEQNHAEAVAEAFSDVWCNGAGAKAESRAVVAELNKYFNK